MERGVESCIYGRRSISPRHSATSSKVVSTKPGDSVSQEDTPSTGHQASHLARHLADVVSKEVSGSVACLMHDIELRLTMAINNLAIGKQEVPDDGKSQRAVASTYGSSERDRSPVGVRWTSEVQSQCSFDCQSQKTSPEWLKRSLDSGNVSMKELEKYNTNHLLEARMSEKMREKMAAKSRSWFRSASGDQAPTGRDASARPPAWSSSASAGAACPPRCEAPAPPEPPAPRLLPPPLPLHGAAPGEAACGGPRQPEDLGVKSPPYSEALPHPMGSKAAASKQTRRSRAVHPETERTLERRPTFEDVEHGGLSGTGGLAGREAGAAAPRRHPSSPDERPSFDSGRSNRRTPVPEPGRQAAHRAGNDDEEEWSVRQQASQAKEDGPGSASVKGNRSQWRFHSVCRSLSLWSSSSQGLPVEEVRGGEDPGSYVSRQILSSRKEFTNIVSVADGGSRTPSNATPIWNNTTFASLAADVQPDEPRDLFRWRIMPSWCPSFPWDEANPSRCWRYGSTFSSAVAQCLALVACVCVVLFSIRQHVSGVAHWDEPSMDSTQLFLCFVDLIVASGGLFGFLALWKIDAIRLWVHIECMVGKFDYRKKLVSSWRTSSTRRLYLFTSCWLLSTTMHFLAELDIDQQQCWPALEVGNGDVIFVRVLMFAFSSGVLVGIMYYLDHLCRVMVMMVDAYCFHCVHSSADVAVLSEDWNILQALLREVAGTCDLAILSLLVTFSSAVVVALLVPMSAEVTELRTFWVLVIVGPLFLLAGDVLMMAAQVTEKCRRVPSIANSMTFRFLAGDRFFLTQYIAQSNAGFYLREVLVNGTMVLKVGHITFLAVFALLSRLLAKG